ncbi:hypothetical protein ACFLV8_02210 [Chloroflexota bacterium]
MTNLGTATALGIHVLAGYDAGDGQIWNANQYESLNLAVGDQVDTTLNLRFPPPDIHTKVLVRVVMDGYSGSSSHSE